MATDTLDLSDPHDAAAALRMGPDERRERGLSPDDVREAFLTVAARGTRDDKRLDDVTLPELDLDHEVVEGGDNHPVDLSGASIEGLSAVHADVRVPLVLDGADVGGVVLDEARVAATVSLAGADVDSLSAFETRFEGDVAATGARLGPVAADEAVFGDDASFDGATFAGDVDLRAAEFHGDSNLLDDNTSFTGATFEGALDCTQASFGASHFEDVAFEEATFEEAGFDGDAEFDGATFAGTADFDEADFHEDTSFADCTFEGVADFRGAEFEGGARALEADVTFAGARFEDRATFERGWFRRALFEDVAFEEAVFRAAEFHGDGEFAGAAFAGEADFDEARFYADADFSGSQFRERCTFRGAEFLGDANHVEDNATFADATFGAGGSFENATFTSGDFTGVRFGDDVDFSGVSFTDRLDAHMLEAGTDATVDFTGASLKDGRIVQPEGEWVGYDFTDASVGDLRLDAERESDRTELLDHFHFRNTEFTEFDGHEFDFSRHTAYLDRNDWVLHEFVDGGADDPETVERTYLKAKSCASAAGQAKAAGEFRVKRQQWARRKNLRVARDPDASLVTRARNASRAAENAFLGVTCGHGMRLLRIVAVFLLAPLVPALLYAFGGPAFETGAGQVESLSALATAAGRRTLFENVYFSYISYTTIGYGDIGPKGSLARVLAGTEAYLSAVLAALVVYALVKRSEL